MITPAAGTARSTRIAPDVHESQRSLAPVSRFENYAFLERQRRRCFAYQSNSPDVNSVLSAMFTGAPMATDAVPASATATVDGDTKPTRLGEMPTAHDPTFRCPTDTAAAAALVVILVMREAITVGSWWLRSARQWSR